MQLSDDKTRATIDIDGTYDANGLESLIHQLSALRSAMVPPIPTAPPATSNAEDAAANRAQGDSSVQVAVMRGGITRFWVRHGGLGWFSFNLPVDRASQLATYILETSDPGRRATELAHMRRRESDALH